MRHPKRHFAWCFLSVAAADKRLAFARRPPRSFSDRSDFGKPRRLPAGAFARSASYIATLKAIPLA
jgi:hypothetical protein